MKMTREEAIRDFREHWASLAISGSRNKTEFLRRHNYPPMVNDCSLCELTNADCDKCPIEWPETCSGVGGCMSSYYKQWAMCDTPEERKRLAAIIRDLPEKQEVNPKPKFSVGDKVYPISKTVPGFVWDIEFDIHWRKSKERGYFFAVGIEESLTKSAGKTVYICSYHKDATTGNYFFESDLRPYVEPERKEYPKELDCEWTEFKVGDLVEIIASGGNFPNYTPFFELNNLMQFRDKFVKDSSPIRGKHYRIVAIGKHETSPHHNPLYVLQGDNGQVYIMTNTHKEMQLIAPEFKVGDRVKVNGNIGTVRGITKGYPHVGIEFDNPIIGGHDFNRHLPAGKKGHCYFHLYKEIELLPSINHCPEDKTVPVQTITIKFKGPKTICTIKNQFGTFKGRAKCHPTDQWNEKTGADLALERAVEKFNEYQPDA